MLAKTACRDRLARHRRQQPQAARQRETPAHRCIAAPPPVYRTVRLFEQLGIVERHAFQTGRARYEHGGQEHHDHFVDVKSGEVIEFHAPEIEALQAEIAARHGYRILDHRLVIYVERVEEKG